MERRLGSNVLPDTGGVRDQHAYDLTSSLILKGSQISMRTVTLKDYSCLYPGRGAPTNGMGIAVQAAMVVGGHLVPGMYY